MKESIRTSVFAGLFVILVSFVWENSTESNIGFNPQTEIESVTIGNQVWMKKNLDVTAFNNGETIMEAKTKEEWDRAGREGKPAWCYYENNPGNGKKFGKLYNWYAVKSTKGLCPKGWHIPTDKEWSTMVDKIGGKDVAGKKVKTTSGWKAGTNGNNSAGLSIVPGGYRDNETTFTNNGVTGYYWSSSEYLKVNAWSRTFTYNNDYAVRYVYYKEDGLSCRCIKD